MNLRHIPFQYDIVTTYTSLFMLRYLTCLEDLTSNDFISKWSYDFCVLFLMLKFKRSSGMQANETARIISGGWMVKGRCILTHIQNVYYSLAAASCMLHVVSTPILHSQSSVLQLVPCTTHLFWVCVRTHLRISAAMSHDHQSQQIYPASPLCLDPPSLVRALSQFLPPLAALSLTSRLASARAYQTSKSYVPTPKLPTPNPISQGTRRQVRATGVAREGV